MSDESVIQEILAIRARLDDLLSRLEPKKIRSEPFVSSSRFMKIPDFAKSRGLSPRTVRDYCELGMPHRGEGRGRRVLVEQANAWIDDGGPRRARAGKERAA